MESQIKTTNKVSNEKKNRLNKNKPVSTQFENHAMQFALKNLQIGNKTIHSHNTFRANKKNSQICDNK